MEGSLSPEQEARFNAHLEQCSSCSSLAREFHLLGETIIKEKRLEPNPFLKTRILQHIDNHNLDAHSERGYHLPRILQPAIITISLVAALLTGYLLGRQATPGNPQSAMIREQIEVLRSDLFTTDFIDENKSLLNNK